jgi:hypothetical protein
MKRIIEPDVGLIRDENNMLDQDSADKAILNLRKKLVDETIHQNRDNSYANAKGIRRDLVVKFQIFQRNSINKHVVISDDINDGFENLSGLATDPFKYRLMEYVDGEIDVREMPMTAATFGKWLHSCFVGVNSYLRSMGIWG